MSSRTGSRMDPFPDGEAEQGLGRRGANADEGGPSVQAPTRTDVLQTVFGIGEQDVRTYDAVVEIRGATTTELADHLGRDRSNVNRSLNRLRESGLVTRGRRLLDDGGHVYQYYAVDEASDASVARAVDRWRSAALDAIESD